MANIVSMDVKDRNIFVELKIVEEEYKLLQSASFDILLVPTDPGLFSHTLTTGTLGNSYRIMLPKKIMKKFNIQNVIRHAPCSILDFNNSKYLVLKLEDKQLGVPKFAEEKSG